MKKLTKLFISILTVATLALPVLFTACDKGGSTPSTGGNDNNPGNNAEVVDYVGSLSLDFASDTKKQEVTVRLFVDGDTTHFDPVKNSNLTSYNEADFTKTQGYIKARYIAINTPESTGKIEEWGKAASKFTRGKLEKAQSIVVESDDSKWNIDSTGERYVLWIWYKPQGETEYRNLNLEILQEGLAFGSSVSNNRYGPLANAAMSQARSLKRYVFSDDKDPDFPYGEATPVTLKELRCHVADYDGVKVRVEGVVAAKFNNSVYIEDLDEEENVYFGMSVYYGYQTGKILEVLSVGNRVSVVGVVSYYEGGDSYQISGVSYDAFQPSESNTTIVSKGNAPAFVDTEARDLVDGKLSVDFIKETEDENGELKVEVETIELNYGDAVMSTSVKVQNLEVVSVYTTSNGGKNDGAMSITCRAEDGTTITVRTEVLKDSNGNLLTAAKFPAGTKITVKGIVEKYDGEYQVKCYRTDFIEILA